MRSDHLAKHVKTHNNGKTITKKPKKVEADSSSSTGIPSPNLSSPNSMTSLPSPGLISPNIPQITTKQNEINCHPPSYPYQFPSNQKPAETNLLPTYQTPFSSYSNHYMTNSKEITPFSNHYVTSSKDITPFSNQYLSNAKENNLTYSMANSVASSMNSMSPSPVGNIPSPVSSSVTSPVNNTGFSQHYMFGNYGEQYILP